MDFYFQLVFKSLLGFDSDSNWIYDYRVCTDSSVIESDRTIQAVAFIGECFDCRIAWSKGCLDGVSLVAF